MRTLDTLFAGQTAHAEPLPVEREVELIGLAKRGDSDAMTELLFAYGPALRSTVTRNVRHLEPWAREQAIEDARGAVLTAFVELVQSHDVDKSPRLAGRVINALQHAIGELSRLDAALSVPEVTLSRFYSALRAAHGDVDQARKLAPEHRLSEGTFNLVLAVVRKTSSLTTEEGSDGESMLASPLTGDVTSPYDTVEDELLVKLAFESIEEGETRIVELAYGFSDYEPQSDAEIAERLALTRPTVQRKRGKALDTMRKTLGVTYAA